MPSTELSSEVVLLGFLPPLLYSAAIRTSILDFRHNLRPIAYLSVLLVLITALGVAVVTWLLLPVSFAVALTGTLLAAAALSLHRVWRASRASGRRPAALALAGAVAVPLVGVVAGLPLAGPSLTVSPPTTIADAPTIADPNATSAGVRLSPSA